MAPTEKPSRWTTTLARVSETITDTVATVNAAQDHIVSEYFDRYSVTLTYWALAFVFLYLGFQKVVPHRSAADVQLATIGGVVGLPYIPFVTFIGAWQMVIGFLFLRRRLRLCAWFFFSYQVFTLSTLIVLWKIVFQPPWLSFLGIEIPWALGAYAAFILKNLVFAAIFFILATQEVGTAEDTSATSDTAGAAAGDRWGLRSRLAGGWRTLFSTRPGRTAARTFPAARAVRHRLGTLVAPVRAAHGRLVERSHAAQNHLVENYFRPHGVSILYSSYGFIWFYFGFQKPAPVYSPVRHPLSEFFPHFAIPLEGGMVFIGLFEMFLGLLFFFREIRMAFWLFFGHQAVTLLTLAVIPFVAFQPPYLPLLGTQVPWALTGYGAFVIKNVVFIAGFTLLASIELGDRTVGGGANGPTDIEGTGALE